MSVLSKFMPGVYNMDNDLYNKTKTLLKQLNYFIGHVLIFMVANAFLVHIAFSEVSKRWWILTLVMIWAISLIYHGMRVYGIDPLNPKNKKAKFFFGWLFKLAGS
ncbi:MAG: 2TM domain-containing protein [Bacteroidota bacterium]